MGMGSIPWRRYKVIHMKNGKALIPAIRRQASEICTRCSRDLEQLSCPEIAVQVLKSIFLTFQRIRNDYSP
jgi:hypothetical protein